MKIKVQPEDFQVDEILGVEPGSAGHFAIYRLTKRSIGTPEAIHELCRQWRLRPQQVSFGGLKDRHAQTSQHLTIERGPKSSLKGRLWTLTYLGQVPEPFTAQHFCGNHFRITLRDLSKPAVSRIRVQLEQIRRVGVVNYFDDQRLRSRSEDGTFIARLLIAGEFEAAVKLAIAEPYRHDRAAEKEAKRLLRERWGDWPLLTATIPAGHSAQRVVRHLRDRTGDFKGAFIRLPHELQSLYLAAYQSWLWNRIAARLIEDATSHRERCWIPTQHGKLPMHRRPLDAARQLQDVELPLPSARLRLAIDDPLQNFYAKVLAEEGLTLTEMRIPGLREPFFSKGARKLVFMPADLSETKGRDERFAGKWKLQLAFSLPRGSYATMLIKRVAQLVQARDTHPANLDTTADAAHLDGIGK